MKVGPLVVDYRTWKMLAWCGPIFMGTFVVFWGILAGNIPPFSPAASAVEVKEHYLQNSTSIMIGMSVCLTVTSFYMAWGCAISQVMRRVHTGDSHLASIEMMGATITAAPIMTACAIWLTAAHEVQALSPEIMHMLYWFGWLLIDLAYMVTSFQIAAISIVFMRDKREKPLVPAWVSWWGWVTFASFFPVSLIPFVTTGPFAFNGSFNFWIAFFTWFIWCPSLSFYIIKAIPRLKAEDEAAAALGRPAHVD
ncbi:hypothetical protein [Pseudonocardia spinosispora]|uniref:hypothetical protein n=1 Tax=Pseudonocardia spinosispora TaxID=103441 RepID=UPI0003F5B75B|nr:hypothetical protein [Pseudonocardia spinosispora]